MNFLARFTAAAFFALLANPVFSQNILIHFQKSDALFVCGADTFFISVQNIGATAISGADLKVELPTGIAYLPGTVSGAAQQNIGNLQQPVFDLPDLAAGATAQVALLIPNAFTPNDDGVNDVFRVVPYEGLEVIGSLTIYDRWGEKVYENQGDVFWDGTIAGKQGPSDVYVYRIEIFCDGEPKAVWGDVTLLR